MNVRVLVPSGVLGLGFDAEALAEGVRRKPDIICIDGGSTDSGPFYLGTATSKYAESVCYSEWSQLMAARHELGVPLMIGSCGTCGADAMVDWMYEMTVRIAAEQSQSVTIARIYSEQDKSVLKTAIYEGRMACLEPEIHLDEPHIENITHCVALAGVEPFQKAIAAGADIVLAGRATDTAIIAALPLMRGADAGACWHGAKIAECGAFCTTHPGSGVILLDIDEDGFTVEPMASEARCTPHSVSAHMLYENANPFILYEPGGYLDVTEAEYSAIDDRRVRVEGSRWTPTEPYTVKLEGAVLAGYQTIMLALIRDARYCQNIDIWVEKLRDVSTVQIEKIMGLNEDEFSLEFRLIGKDAALGALETAPSGLIREVGVLVIITAQSQSEATEISRLINPYLLHLGLTENEDMPTFAFPYSPAHSERGVLYEYALHHVLHLSSPTQGFRMQIDRV